MVLCIIKFGINHPTFDVYLGYIILSNNVTIKLYFQSGGLVTSSVSDSPFKSKRIPKAFIKKRLTENEVRGIICKRYSYAMCIFEYMFFLEVVANVVHASIVDIMG